MGKLLPQPHFVGDLPQRYPGQIAGQYPLGLAPDRNLTAYPTVATRPFPFFEAFHEQERPLKTFIDLFEADFWGGLLQGEPPMRSHVGVHQAAARSLLHHLREEMGRNILLALYL